MLPDGAINAVHVWKRFRADRRRRQLRDQVQDLGPRLLGHSRRGWRWALQDVEFIAAPGESVGLIGPNGSGKSTLLKLLTRVMYPHSGSITIGGRVGALIEVRAGIHPELSGRENVYLYGTLLGLERRQVTRRFDEIVAFAQLEGAIDRQTKFYSSGMQMRLGFSVAAFLQPAVLLVDEILAVGDASFQQRCLERMSAVLAEGTTLVFVSHDLAAIEAVSERGVWLENGQVQADGPIRDILRQYRQSLEESAELGTTVSGYVRLAKAEVSGDGGQTPRTQEPLDIKLVIESPAEHTGTVCIGVSEGTATPIFAVHHDMGFPVGETEIRCSITRLPLPRGRFYIWIGIVRTNRELLPWHPAAYFDVIGADLDAVPRGVVRLSPVHVQAKWDSERV